MTAKTYVVLSAAVRTHARVRVGAPVFLVALPAREVLLVHSLAVLDGLLAGYHSAVLGGEPA